MFKRGSVTRNSNYVPYSTNTVDISAKQSTNEMDIATILSDQLPNSQFPAQRRWKGLVLPKNEFAVIKATDPNTKKSYHHLMVNVFQKDKIITIANELLTEFDKEKTGRQLRPVPVNPATYGIQTKEKNDWFMFMYVSPKAGEELKACKENELYVRCIYWENADSLYKNGVSLTGMRIATDLKQIENGDAGPLDGWEIQVV